MMWASSLGSWGTFVSPAQLDSWPRPLLSFPPLPQTPPIFSAVKCLVFLLQNDSSFLFPLPLHPSFSRWCRHCCFLPSSSHSWLFLPHQLPWSWHSLWLCAGNNNSSSWKISGEELVVWQIKHKQLRKAILEYLSVSVYSSARWITWVIKAVEEKNLMEMIIWLLPIILTNQAYQLHTSRLSGCLWGFFISLFKSD